jgi:hypothetical protein
MAIQREREPAHVNEEDDLSPESAAAEDEHATSDGGLVRLEIPGPEATEE